MDEDDFFSDDDLNDIPDNTLQALEQNAISSTQRPKSAVARPPPPARKQIPNGTLARPTSVGQNIPWRPPQPNRQAQQAAQNAPPASAPGPPSSDYGFDDEDVIDLDEPSTVIQPSSRPHAASTAAQLRPSAAAQSLYGSKHALDAETADAFAAADAELGAQPLAHWPRPTIAQPSAKRDINDINVSSLQARIAELETDQARLRKAENEARDAAQRKQGEIAIVRANQDKASKEYERRLAVLQKLHADESTKHKAELEATRKEREKMETDNRFLQHDLAQEAERKRLTGPGKARTALAGKEKDTPRKAKRLACGDGFDDDDLQVVSPSKSKGIAKDATPKAGAKRKRTANDSPVAALSFTQPAPPERQQSGEQLPASVEQPLVSLGPVDEDDRYEFMQRLLNHCPYEGHERSIEALTKHSPPSYAGKSLSSLLMDDLTFSSAIKESYLPLRLSRIVLRLWTRCIDDSYFAALYLLIDFLRFALHFELASVRSQLIEDALPLCIRTIDIVAVTQVRASVNPALAASLDQEAQEKLRDQIDVDAVMELMLDLTQAASLTADRLEVFWRRMDFTFFLMMLNKAFPISQIMTALRLLATSTLETTFGIIAADAEKQEKHENDTIDRLTSLLFEMPEVPRDEPDYSEDEIAELRIAILDVIRAMCLTDHGGMLLAHHRTAVGRLTRFLYVQVNKLYTVQPTFDSGTTSTKTAKSDAHALVVQTVNTTVRLLYHLLRTYDSTIDFNQKLQAANGGYQKFLISMTRVAFSEQLVFEHGIEDEVVEAAHSILDNVLTPEEGEAVVKAVETPRGTKSAHTDGNETTEKDTSVEDADTAMSDHG